LTALVSNFANFSERALLSQKNQSVLETGALAIELHSYGRPDHVPLGVGQRKSLHDHHGRARHSRAGSFARVGRFW
jgi:hypothetical protein